ncbi:TPA: hypothetical protein ACK3Q6_002648 [Burkholderia cepacia]|uniref:hypothetical protein n=1 Tax=Burkholderia cepacia TaxID=292 RepID=UPI001CF345AB|nr:hypothetical protein [Burkholderia cepacia]HDR9763589.1 hypothetical protein [Burkholderia cepacia ATCC 25416]MCA8361243.1 hypothetical protein [Burkholderia cepacia]HDR9771145.1 hypothetical protein [Burkholderia cepacia ATCC 25416]HDR9778949.1 hypothetical protein [Burkholderia cepacia ATCC 25416]HDR9785799.1 hypothetical protein [Burkholderia cepacia ATCC 25416]
MEELCIDHNLLQQALDELAGIYMPTRHGIVLYKRVSLWQNDTEIVIDFYSNTIDPAWRECLDVFLKSKPDDIYSKHMKAVSAYEAEKGVFYFDMDAYAMLDRHLAHLNEAHRQHFIQKIAKHIRNPLSKS